MHTALHFHDSLVVKTFDVDKKWLWLLALVQRREDSRSFNKYVLQAYTSLFVNTLDGEVCGEAVFQIDQDVIFVEL
jgi:hypothetical protein